MKYKLYKVPLLEQEILFFYCDGDKELQKLLQKKEVKDYLNRKSCGGLEVGDSLGMCFRIIETNRPIAIYVSSKLKADDLQETISHEIQHAVFYLKQMCNFKEENEFNAYVNGRMNLDFRKFIK